ncbi:undecaprenyldiphospho-muramoylpentapeptide beta-N-acetylglucosaminyltransferase [Dissulfurirhabdus thermomarina]|uniref:UDP-N-acetylglucosamine--N-acetylmuramyl-(pentapeptide) pyrophosphoryl-undecaprenol N-acetylglucosamine transferase n=1 Tax=Dissulfurirhabdus thermomarina TaxID=1765737 RepID=A0A6N9TPZ9_DISTH|nr:undecaprenyldiphospho-muramoylpentapeptide beta-N-acetylglucosaminyltransferase [Dissulfurirhabdus thermomarina]NDY43351.1 undecaprenyldiphospho-muramoylpentapeptide beta-N-acetylglucosaminyltransferase [Dissulfurirhabdus thermomarina]NMX24230.1 undecaprenyldiphospho-muramoylpentapeptide beta-N-acetylglucosaminyltransferase [Dissulfurirhabdus thermomarina]
MPAGSRDVFRLAITGGGTGGHVFPGIAVAEALAARRPMEVLWIGTGRPVERDAFRDRPWDYRVLDVRPLQGVGPVEQVRAVAGLPAAVLRAWRWLREFRPHVVFGVGGYVSGPVLLAARLCGLPAAIHEQNVVPGLANRLAARFANRVFISFAGSADRFPAGKTVLTGNPVRRAILEARRRAPRPRRGVMRLLVLGGSQGARRLNRLASNAVISLWNSGVDLRVTHQTGADDREEIARRYREAGGSHRVEAFITDIHRAYAEADLVLCRAGATTLAELAAVGRPAILVPYPFAAGRHQEANAREMAAAGAARVILEEDTGAVTLAEELRFLLENPEHLDRMCENAARLGRPNAAEEIAGALVELAEGAPTTRPEAEHRPEDGEGDDHV